MKKYQCLLFDLFNTVALWLPERMPHIDVEGERRPSTLGELGKILVDAVPDLALDDFQRALSETNRELAGERAGNSREIPSRERFARALTRCGLVAGSTPVDLAEALSLRHMELLSAATTIPHEHVNALARLKQHYAMAVVSNFDHGATARAILARDGAAQHFGHIVISDGHGWRKPHRRIFEDALSLLGVQAGDALFIGDSIEDDVVGAAAIGMDVAWVNAKSAALPSAAPVPTYTLSAITELEALLH
jgi:HAD superfamily hydrolase (TIGR01549 family)